MAAYATLVSLMHIIKQIQHHPYPPISLDKSHVESLTEKVAFLQDFLEAYSHGGQSKEADDLESRIAFAAYTAEDVIESHLVDQILAGSTSHGEEISFINFYQCIQKVIEDMDFIKKEAMKIKAKMGIQHQPPRSSSYISSNSLRSVTTRQNSIMVGFDDVLYEVVDKLTGGLPDRQVISIVGMGGIGKTTLARNIYENQVIVEHFYILAWVTISQEFIKREILVELILCLKRKMSRESLFQMGEDELEEILYKSLSGRRYLIIMDDIWDIEAWDHLKLFFPDNKNGSGIILTTRLSNLASQAASSHIIELGFLDEDDSWKLFCKTVFGKEDCPCDLEDFGKKIVKNCKGLPLSIVVIGGLLTKSELTQQYWKYISENLNSVVSSTDDEHCLQILYMSYNHLLVHLKPCFLYMGVFGEDSEVRVSELIKLWVAEGFLKPIGGRSLEEVAEEYLKELIERNLIIKVCNSYGKIKFCKLHDLLRDLCLREAKKQKFLCVLKVESVNIPRSINIERRIGLHASTSWGKYSPQVLQALESASLARSLIWESQSSLPSFHFRLLRVYSMINREVNSYENSLEAIFQQVNLRYVQVDADYIPSSRFPSSFSLLWNIQTLTGVACNQFLIAPSEIWKMPQLRHIKFRPFGLPNPPNSHMDGQDDIVLENLQTLYIHNFNCGEEVVKRIPNIKKLRIYHDKFEEGSNYCLNNLGLLHKLESLGCFFASYFMPNPSELLQNLTFPHSLKKLTLEYCLLHWEDLTTKIGSLPFLEVLKLKWHSFIGSEWETIEGQFCNLRFLRIEFCNDLEYWTTSSTHFPCLEHLILRGLDKLKEIPSSIGDITTLVSIELNKCSNSAVISAKKILKEQEEFGNDDLQVRVMLRDQDTVLKSLASRNFKVSK